MSRTWRILVVLLLSLSGLLLLLPRPRSPESREVSQSGAGFIEGQVVDDEGPVVGAVVRIKGRSGSVTTDAAGLFSISASALNSRVTAAKKGYLIAGADSGERPITIRLKSYADDDSPSYEWVDPRPESSDEFGCAKCHPGVYQEWSRSSHATSATNLRFLNVYDGADWSGRSNRGWNLLAERPLGKAVCYSCHIPSAPATVEASQDVRAVSGVDALGIHCDFCHKVAEVNVDQIGLNHGRFAMRHVRPSRGQVFFGPLDDVDRGENAWLPLYRKSEYCASCHEGTMFGIAAYTTYSEWQDSPHARRGLQCQSCHMASDGTRTQMAVGEGAIRRDSAMLSNHEFPGGTLPLLRKALSLDLMVTRSGDRWEVITSVHVRGVGHRLPTGHPARELLLWIDARDENGNRLEQLSGPVLPALAGVGGGREHLAGQPGHLYAKTLEGFDGELDPPVWNAARIASDTRLAPDSSDRQTFEFSGRGRARIAAELIYRRFSQPQAELKGWPDNQMTAVRKEWSSNDL